MFALKRRLYERAPQMVKRWIGCVPFHWLAGRGYREVRNRDHLFEAASSDNVLAFQRAALRTILLQATQHVPAYQRFREATVDLDPEEALSQFPLLDKQALKENFRDYLSPSVPGHRTWKSSTGGTTGDQLHFVLDDGAQSREMGFIHRLWSQAGYTPQSRKATIRGVEFPSLSEGVYWQENPIYNECQFSPFHLSDQTFPRYLEQLRRYDPEYIHGYPSAVALLAGHLLNRSETLPVRAVLLGSESLFPEQREQIERAFEAKVLSWYGHSERIILAGECEHDHAYHSVPDYGWMEIVDDEGEPVDEGETGELVGTGFWNEAMPLVRYRTGDRARRLSTECDCGRAVQRFDRVEGRWKQEYVIGHNGAKISVAALNMHGPFYDRVLRYQYHQEQQGHVTVRILPANGFGERDMAALEEAIRRRVGEELNVDIRVVDDIPLTSRGKLKRLIQELPEDVELVGAADHE